MLLMNIISVVSTLFKSMLKGLFHTGI